MLAEKLSETTAASTDGAAVLQSLRPTAQWVRIIQKLAKIPFLHVQAINL
jgi:hypothetical protein